MTLKSAAFEFHVDSPRDRVAGVSFLLAGWIAAPAGSRLSSPLLRSEAGDAYPLTEMARPDVETAFPDSATLGFRRRMSLRDVAPEDVLFVEFLLDGERERFSFSFEGIEAHQAEVFRHHKSNKLERLTSILCCPVCNGQLRYDARGPILCSGCDKTFGRTRSHYDFLSEELTQLGRVQATESVSAHPYDPRATQLVAELQGGLVLDNGSGLRDAYYENVVNFEIVDYPSTDVLGVGERLPFKSGAFDAVFSFAVLEHVRDPFQCAKECVRVLKPGGIMYAAVPFLQPFHGYPDHYYNMSSSGLRNLFADELEILDVGVPQSGLPIWCLTWFLKSYAAGLPEPHRKRFEKMRVEELMGEAAGYLDNAFVRELSAAANEELACVNYLLGRKPPP